MRPGTSLFAAAALVLIAIGPSPAAAQRQPSPRDDRIRHQIIQESIWAYTATGRACGCPFERAANGTRCGGSSAYNREAPAHPLCYRADITERMVGAWKRAHGIP